MRQRNHAPSRRSNQMASSRPGRCLMATVGVVGPVLAALVALGGCGGGTRPGEQQGGEVIESEIDPEMWLLSDELKATVNPAALLDTTTALPTQPALELDVRIDGEVVRGGLALYQFEPLDVEYQIVTCTTGHPKGGSDADVYLLGFANDGDSDKLHPIMSSTRIGKRLDWFAIPRDLLSPGQLYYVGVYGYGGRADGTNDYTLEYQVSNELPRATATTVEIADGEESRWFHFRMPGGQAHKVRQVSDHHAALYS